MLNIISQNHLCRRRLFETTEGAKDFKIVFGIIFYLKSFTMTPKASP